jgi:C-terminal processing protease CtpA/Prc
MSFPARVVATLLAGAALFGCATAPSPFTPEHATHDEQLTPVQLQEDFRALYEGLQRAHINLFANRTKAEFDQAFAETLTKLDRPLTKAEAQIRFQIFVAQGRVAHARIDAPMDAFSAFREGGGKNFPFGVRLAGDRVFVAENLSGLSAVASGDEILAINGERAARWVERLRRHISADNDYLADAILEPQFTLALWLELGEVETFSVRFRTHAGRRLDLTIPARTRAQMRATRLAAPAGLEVESAARETRMLPNGVAYLRPGVFMNVAEGGDPYDAAAFHHFIDDAFTRFIAEGATTLLIDVRDNPGGDNSFSDHMIAWFADRPFRFSSDFRVRVSPEAIAANAARLKQVSPDGISRQYAAAYAGASSGDIIRFPIPMTEPRATERFTGRVFVLINRRSFSNAASVAAIVQDYRFGQVLGEPTADLATTYGAMETFSLPNSGIVVGFPKAHIIRPSGDERGQGVTPDFVITTPIVEPTDDPVLEEALRRVEDLSNGPR